MARRTGAFRMWKYYLDCISPAGDVCICYVGCLRWGPLAIRYCALLECDADGAQREQHHFAPTPEPVSSADGIEWACEALGVRGNWRTRGSAHEATLLAGAAGQVQWRVLAPISEVSLERPAGPLEGCGYVERLDLSIEPWRLPIRTLHWGRFHSEGDSLIWIGWDGEHRLRHIVHNGELLDDGVFGEHALRFEPGLELRLTSTRTVHDAPVVAAVERLPRVLRRVPPGFMAAREVKWLSRAQLSGSGRTPVTGWALHERVAMG
jgi:hypothetical protein